MRYLADGDLKVNHFVSFPDNHEACLLFNLILKYLESIEKKKTIRASRKSQLNIIDNFIKNEPQVSRVTPTKSSSNEPQEDFSKKSVVKNSVLLEIKFLKTYKRIIPS